MCALSKIFFLGEDKEKPRNTCVHFFELPIESMKKYISSVSGSTDSTCLESFQKDAVWERLHHRKSSQVNFGMLSCTKGTRAWQMETARSNTNSFHIKIWRYQQEDEPLILIFPEACRAPTRQFFIHFLEALLPACLDFSVTRIQNGFKSKQVGGP